MYWLDYTRTRYFAQAKGGLNGSLKIRCHYSIFLWREVKHAERYENLYNEERRLRHEAEGKCATCQFVRRANEELLERIKDKDDKPMST